MNILHKIQFTRQTILKDDINRVFISWNKFGAYVTDMLIVAKIFIAIYPVELRSCEKS